VSLPPLSERISTSRSPRLEKCVAQRLAKRAAIAAGSRSSRSASRSAKYLYEKVQGRFRQGSGKVQGRFREGGSAKYRCHSAEPSRRTSHCEEFSREETCRIRKVGA
jgi:hypothetical protein